MCLIADVNVASKLVDVDEDSQPIVKWLDSNRGKLAIGGRLSEELMNNRRLWRKLVAYSRAGRCHTYSKEKIEAQYGNMSDDDITSNDRHILALARVSGCRLLYTRDNALAADFRNRRIIPPRDGHGGRIYRDNRDHDR